MADRIPHPRPDIYTYQDYRQFLKDWLAYKKASQSGFSLRKLSEKAGLSLGYLNMVTSGKRNLSNSKLQSLKPHLGISDLELEFLKKLMSINDSKNQKQKIENVKKLIRSKNYRSKNQKEVETYRYLNNWYTVVIHELAGRKDFQAEPAWIQEKLGPQITKAEIRQSLKFLIENDFLIKHGKSYKRSQRRLICDDDIYRLSLSSFHRQMFHLASESIENTSREERMILGHTRNLSAKNYDKAQEILKNALEEIAQLENSDSMNTRVYHFGFLGFPTTVSGEEDNS